MVCLVKEEVLVIEGPDHGIPLEGMIFLNHFHGDLIIPDYLGTPNRSRTQDYLELQNLEKIMVHRLGASSPRGSLMKELLLIALCRRDPLATNKYFSKFL